MFSTSSERELLNVGMKEEEGCVPRPLPVGSEVDRVRLRDANSSSRAIRTEFVIYCRNVVMSAEVKAALGSVLNPPVATYQMC